MASISYMSAGKHILDVALALFLSVMLSPLMLLIAAAIKLTQGSPILFYHKRPGWHAKPFTLYKFRTMTNVTDDSGNLLSDHVRLTKFGKFLRNTSLDELPELFNVLRGDMSMVGPRPLLMQYLERYSPEQMRRHEVRPGITGWAQVHGRNAITWDEKFHLDVWYVDHLSFTLDIKIVCMTIMKIITREGISQPGYVSSEEFRGSKQMS